MRLEDFLRRGERRAFAVKIGCSKSNIDRICCGTMRPSPDMALKIVHACKDRNGAEQVRMSDLPGYSDDYPVTRPPRAPDKRRAPTEAAAQAS